MLVLTRKQGQTIRIGDAVVSVERIVGGAVKLGVAAPLNIEVDRGEVAERKRLERADDVGEGSA